MSILVFLSNEFFGMDVTSDIGWTLQPGKKLATNINYNRFTYINKLS